MDLPILQKPAARIRRNVARFAWTREQLVSHCLNALARLRNYARDRSPVYRELPLGGWQVADEPEKLSVSICGFEETFSCEQIAGGLTNNLTLPRRCRRESKSEELMRYHGGLTGQAPFFGSHIARWQKVEV